MVTFTLIYRNQNITSVAYRDQAITSVDTISFAYRRTATSKRKWHVTTPVRNPHFYTFTLLNPFTATRRTAHSCSLRHERNVNTRSRSALAAHWIRLTERSGAARSSRECARVTLAMSAVCALSPCRRSSHPLALVLFLLFESIPRNSASNVPRSPVLARAYLRSYNLFPASFIRGIRSLQSMTLREKDANWRCIPPAVRRIRI